MKEMAEPTLGERATVWRLAHYPESSTVSMVMAKATEELGEVARALIGDLEGREGRGDVIQEAAQLVIVVASLVHIHTGKDLLDYIEPEMQRMGA